MARETSPRWNYVINLVVRTYNIEKIVDESNNDLLVVTDDYADAVKTILNIKE